MKKKIISVALAAAVALMVNMIPQQKAAAFGYFFGGTTPVAYPQSNITWCLNEMDWNSNLAVGTLDTAFEHWDNYATLRTFTRTYAGDPNCNIRVYISYSFSGFIAQGAPTVRYGNLISQSELRVNANLFSTFWLSTAHHYCTVVCSSQPNDFFTIMVHEIGHTIGLGHNSSGAYCGAGGDTEQGYLFCWNQFYSLDPMYTNAGDGYRRWISEDSLRGLKGLGYRS